MNPKTSYRKPAYDVRERPDGVTLVIYVPGVDTSGVDIEAHGTDLSVTAHKTRFVRVNWQALNLEASQPDYRLGVRLGVGFDFAAMKAEMRNGILTIRLPKRSSAVADTAAPLRRVA